MTSGTRWVSQSLFVCVATLNSRARPTARAICVSPVTHAHTRATSSPHAPTPNQCPRCPRPHCPQSQTTGQPAIPESPLQLFTDARPEVLRSCLPGPPGIFCRKPSRRSGLRSSLCSRVPLLANAGASPRGPAWCGVAPPLWKCNKTLLSVASLSMLYKLKPSTHS